MSGYSRITEVILKNFKNVGYGKISKLEFSGDEPSLLGIYGQNGSGKTALVEACLLLKYLMSGFKIPDSFVQTISADKEYSELEFSFVLSINEIDSPVYIDYSFKLDRQIKMPQDGQESGYQVRVFDEIVKVSCSSIVGFSSKTKLIDTIKGDSYCPNSLLKDLSKGSKKALDNLKKIRFLAQNTSLSSIFNSMTAQQFNASSNSFFKNVIFSLRDFGLSKLFVITTLEQNLLDFGLLPLNFSVDEEKSEKNIEDKLDGHSSVGKLILPLKSNIQIPVAHVRVIQKAITSLNGVLTKVVPGLMVELQEKGRLTNSKGQEVCNVVVLSNRNGIKLPLETESNGVKKLISILQLIITVYNRSDITVVIDELDAGIFEYLLGELLAVIAEGGKGQLFFTSHNLRPLELLDKKYLCFTSVNPKNRYVRVRGVKTNNNLRDFYYRDIQLGLQHDALYDSTDRSQIAFYLYEAGNPSAR